MAKNIISANGTVHLFNSATKKSWCGRVTPDQEDVRMTTKEAGCGRCAQLRDGAATKTSDTPVKAAVKPVKASKSVKATVTADTGQEDASDYYSQFYPLLDHNGVGYTIDAGPSGSSLDFTIGAWAYKVFGPDDSASGEWVVAFSEDFSTDQDEESFGSNADVYSWLVKDAELDAPKPTGPRKAAKAVTKPSTASKGSDTYAAMVEAAYALAQAALEFTDDTTEVQTLTNVVAALSLIK